MNTQLAVLSLYAKDVPSTAHFYRDEIGLRLIPHHSGRLHFDLGGVYLTILEGQPPSAAAHFPVVAFSVDDLDVAIGRLQAHGVELPWGIEEYDGTRWVMFHDPAGNLIELVEGVFLSRRSLSNLSP
jgi:catechol 2,3-dioxygenase-like lactoylglutathione lyase family enzyme